MVTCFPSIAPKQLGKFHRSWNRSAIFFHSSGVVGNYMEQKREIFTNKEQMINNTDHHIYVLYNLLLFSFFYISE